MKKVFYALMAIVALVFAGNTVKADDIDVKTEFKREQEVCTENFVKAWLEQKNDKEMKTLFAYMVEANVNYTLACGGIDNSLTGTMIRAMENGKTEKEKFNLAACEYFRSKGIKLDTRSNFNRGSFKVQILIEEVVPKEKK